MPRESQRRGDDDDDDDDVNDDDDCDDTDDDGDDDDDDKYLSKNLQSCKTPENWPAITQKKLIPKYPENSQTIPGLKIEANPDPEIFTKSRPENPGIEIVDPARAWSQPIPSTYSFWAFENLSLYLVHRNI